MEKFITDRFSLSLIICFVATQKKWKDFYYFSIYVQARYLYTIVCNADSPYDN